MQNCQLELFQKLKNQTMKTDICTNGDSSCRYKRTTIVKTISEPFPLVFIMNVSWHVNGISYLETFNFGLSLTHSFSLNDLFVCNE